MFEGINHKFYLRHGSIIEGNLNSDINRTRHSFKNRGNINEIVLRSESELQAIKQYNKILFIPGIFLHHTLSWGE